MTADTRTTTVEQLAAALKSEGFVQGVAKRYGSFSQSYWERAADAIFAALPSNDVGGSSMSEGQPAGGRPSSDLNSGSVKLAEPSEADRLLVALMAAFDAMEGYRTEDEYSALTEAFDEAEAAARAYLERKGLA